MHILLKTDDGCVSHTGALIVSLLKSQRKDKELTFHIVHDTLSDNNKEKLDSLESLRTFCLKYYDGTKIVNKDLWPIDFDFISPTDCYDLFAHCYVGDTDRVIYLDPLAFVLQDLGKLWEWPLGGNMVAGVPVPDAKSAERLRPCGFIPEEHLYCYKGIYLLNLACMEEQGVEKKVFPLFKKSAYLFDDQKQDAVNVLFRGNVEKIPTSYCVPDESGELANPHVVYFSGKIKPWHNTYRDSLGDVYWNCLKQTPWCDREPITFSTDQYLKDHLFKMLRKIKEILSRILILKIIYRLIKKPFELYHHHLIKKLLQRNKKTMPLEIIENSMSVSTFYPKNRSFFYLNKIIGSSFTKDLLNANMAFIWGVRFDSEKIIFLKKVVKHHLPLVILEDGFIRSIEIGDIKHKSPGLSCIMDHAGIYYDDTLGSAIHQLLDSSWKITKQEEEVGRKAISFILSKELSKYNFMKPISKNFNLEDRYRSVCLVLDQRKGDQSVAGARANALSFARMLKDTIRENPQDLILIKIHPDALLADHQGYFTHLCSKPKTSNVQILSENINAISLLKAVDKVYTVSSQMGFEALMCRKKVYCYGWPFYSDRGLTVDRGKKRKKISKKRTLEEVFYASYIKYTRYFNPDTYRSCDIFETMEYLVRERDKR